MKWRYLNTGAGTGSFNMDVDLRLAGICSSDEAYFRLYRWNPYCISLGANQSYDSILLDKATSDGIDVVKRPTGGRAILHSEELTYSVAMPIIGETSARNIYHEINQALLLGLTDYDSALKKAELENTQPDFPSFYKEEKSAACFAVPAKSELKFDRKKLVGSAQRKLGSTILQHGSILCGNYHLGIADYLNITHDAAKNLKDEMKETTVDLKSILNSEIDYGRLCVSLVNGFENYFGIKFEKSGLDDLPVFEKILTSVSGS